MTDDAPLALAVPPTDSASTAPVAAVTADSHAGAHATESRDFLETRSSQSLRREIQNLVDSYSHPWDTLAELVQNSVDAIRRHRFLYGAVGQPNHRIDITIDQRERAITVRDTGIGIDGDRFISLLAPHGTDKADDPDAIGEKGVGLTYTIFVCNAYSIETRSATSYVAGHITDGARWRTNKVAEVPRFQQTADRREPSAPDATFTVVSLGDVEAVFGEVDDLFNQTPRVLEYLLRTRTAIGFTREETDETKIEISLTVVDATRSNTFPIRFGYMWPDEFLAGKTLDLDDFKERAGTLDDRQKARALAGRALVKRGSIARSNRLIRFYAIFAPSRGLWREISEIGNFTSTDSAGEVTHLFTGGIFVATKGMPTGVQLEQPPTGQAGNWPNFFMLLEDDSITFDLGRKAVPGRTKGMLREIAQNLFEEFRPYMSLVNQDPAVVAGPSPTVLTARRNDQFAILHSLSDLALPEIGYLKHPDGQEAAVMALFHELVGAAYLKGYNSYRSGLRETYDLWARYRVPKDLVGRNQQINAGADGMIDLDIIIEFKYAAHRVLVDFDAGSKHFPDIDLIVCWDVDEAKFKGWDVKVDPLPPDDVLFFGSNYRLTWAGAYNLGAASEKPVLALRKFIQDLTAARQTSPSAR